MRTRNYITFRTIIKKILRTSSKPKSKRIWPTDQPLSKILYQFFLSNMIQISQTSFLAFTTPNTLFLCRWNNHELGILGVESANNYSTSKLQNFRVASLFSKCGRTSSPHIGRTSSRSFSPQFPTKVNKCDSYNKLQPFKNAGVSLISPNRSSFHTNLSRY